MSRQNSVLDFIVEWSPDSVTIYDPRSKASHPFSSIVDASVALGTGKSVRVGISRRSSFIKPVRVPDAPKTEVLQMLALTAGTHLPLPAQEIAFDVRLTDDVNAEGRLGIVGAVRSEDLRELHRQLETAHWQAVDILPSALGSILVTERAGQPNAAIIQKSSEGWSIDLVVNGELRYSRTLPGSLPSLSIEEEISRTYAAAQLPCSAVVAAGGLNLPYANLRTDYSSLEMLALQQADLLGLHVELGEVLSARQTKARALRLRAAALMMVASLLLAGYAFNDRATAQSAINKQKSIWVAGDRKMQGLKSDQDTKVSDAEAMQTTLDRGFHPAQRMSDVLTVGSNLAPSGTWLTGIGIERGKQLLIRGTSTSSEGVSSFVSALSAERRFRNVRLVFANNGTIEQRPVVQFSISAFAVGNLPLNDIPTPGKAK